MKGDFDFGKVIDRGPGTHAVDAILRLWADIDWFEPLERTVDPKVMFTEHVDIARALDPAYYPDAIEFEVIDGTREDFGELCWILLDRSSASRRPKVSVLSRLRGLFAQHDAEKRARHAAWQDRFKSEIERAKRWDWRYGLLKQIRSDEEKRSGWSADAVAQPLSSAPAPGVLFFRGPGQSSIWLGEFPELEFLSWEESQASYANWQLGYANMDLMHAAAWQLSRGTDDLEGNPFLPILRLYEAGVLPFVFSPSLVVLFRFVPE